MSHAIGPRVLILTAYFRPVIGGVETSAERLARYLRDAGCSVQILTKRITTDLSDVEDLDGVRVRRIGSFGHRLPGEKWRLILPTAFWLVRHASTYDIVCCVDYRAIGIAAILARAVTRAPVILQAGTTGVLSAANADGALRRLRLSPNGLPARLLKWPLRGIYRRADAFACISAEIEREARDCGIPTGDIHYLPNAVDTTAFRAPTEKYRRALRQRLGVMGDEVVCMFVGRLSREKGLLDLLEAWRIRQTAGPVGDADGSRPLLLIAGPDMPEHAWNVGPAARAFVAEHQLQDSVRFLGASRDVPSWWQAADIAVQPSHFEALGMSALEALACGVPVVASAVGGLLDFLVDGVNARLCPPQDPHALAAALNQLIIDPTLRRQLAEVAASSVADRYAEAHVFQRYGTLIRRLADPRAVDARIERALPG